MVPTSVDHPRSRFSIQSHHVLRPLVYRLVGLQSCSQIRRDSEVEVHTLGITEPLPLRGYKVDSIAALGKPLEPQMSSIDPIRMENLLHAAVQSLNPEDLLRSLLS